MNQQETKETQIESVEDLELTNQQAAETTAGKAGGRQNEYLTITLTDSMIT